MRLSRSYPQQSRNRTAVDGKGSSTVNHVADFEDVAADAEGGAEASDEEGAHVLSGEHTQGIISHSKLYVSVPKTSVIVTGWRCGRCGHEWLPQTTAEPKRCPKCKSPYWNRPRVRFIEKAYRGFNDRSTE